MKRYTANTDVKKAVSELIEQFGARLVLEAMAEYCAENLGLSIFGGQLLEAANYLSDAARRTMRKP